MTLDNLIKLIGALGAIISVGGGSAWLFFRRLEKLRRVAETQKVTSESRKVEFDIYDGTIENWKDIVKELKLEVDSMRIRIGDMEKNYLKKIGELETQQQENSQLKGEVKELRKKVKDLSDRLSKYESLPKEENNNIIDI